MKLEVLVDSLEYIRHNCYQHQVLMTLERRFDVKIVPLSSILTRRYDGCSDTILSCLKLRTICGNLYHIKRYLNNHPIFIYEQDPWESFKDDSPYRGCYDRINSTLNVFSFLNTSGWWSDYINKKDIPSKFVKMGVLPEYCLHTPWEKKDIDLGFCGQIHPYRRAFFEYLSGEGLEVAILPTTSYKGYLNHLSRIKVFAHCENVNWIVDGKKVKANSMWIKDIEACARGCISIRDFEKESFLHGSIEEVPSKMSYESFESACHIIRSVLKRSDRENNEIAKRSISYIENNLVWSDIVNAIEKGLVLQGTFGDDRP